MKKKTILEVNKKNNIESIIEIFQYFSPKYDVRTAKLDKNIQYKIKKHKITQTYKTTILNTKEDNLTKKLKNKGKITIIIIDNLKKKNDKNENIISNKIKKMNSLNNVNTVTIKKNNTLKTLDKIIREENQWIIETYTK